ncbi:MAG: hypothetical protein E6H49_07305, partial [Betaproteobacteria bacterium]
MSYTVQPLTGFAANPQSLTFNRLQGAPAPAAQNLGISELSGTSYPWSTSIVYQSGSGWLHINGASSASGATLPTSLSISVDGPGTLGTLNAVVRVTGNGNTLDVPVSYTVSEPTLTSLPAQLIFNAPSTGTLPATQDVTLSTQQNLSLGFSTSISYGAGATGWLNAPANGMAPGQISIGTNTTNLVPGTYTATLTLTTAAQTVPIGIMYVVATSSLTFSPASPSFTIDTTSLASALSQTVTAGTTGVALSWTAASDQPWLSISPSSGTSSTRVTLTLNPAQLDTLDAGLHTAAAVFNYTPPNQSATSASLSVSLNLQIPKVNSVNPYIATSGTSLQVVLRGSGFNSTAGAAVNFGSTAVTTYNALSDTVLLLAHPSLLAGSYRVSFANRLGNPGIVRSTADLVVVDAPAYAAATIAYPNATAKQPLDIIYDAERQSLLVGVAYPTPGSSGEIFRYPFTGSAWATAPASVSVTSFRDLALSLDGKQLIAVSDFAVRKIDPMTLAPGTVTPTLVFETFFKGVAMANDGNAVLTTGYPPVERASTSPWVYLVREDKLSLGPGGIGIVRGTPGSSADGSRVVLSHASPDSTGSYIAQYDSSSSVFSFVPSQVQGVPSTWPGTSIRPKFDRKATRLVMNGYIVIKNSDYFHPSFLPQVAPGDSAAVALSPDGMRAYQYVSGTLLRTFDVSSPDQSVSEIRTGTVLP